MKTFAVFHWRVLQNHAIPPELEREPVFLITGVPDDQTTADMRVTLTRFGLAPGEKRQPWLNYDIAESPREPASSFEDVYTWEEIINSTINTIRLPIRLSLADHEAVRLLAYQENSSMSTVCRKIIHDHLPGVTHAEP